MQRHSPILTVSDVARDLRCSKAHVHNLIRGKVRGLRPLPALRLGRRSLIRFDTLQEWIELNESEAGMIRSSPDIDAADA